MNPQGERESREGVKLTELAQLPPGTMLDETALASALSVSTRTVRRMVDRCEIPAGVKLGGKKYWFSERVLAYLRERADREATEARKAAARFGNKF
ncbi:MAG: hypothetical protein QGH33_11225 [Pirellulaceae bacterium]|jgi:hypothetical protein|nr:hypothetical protein [Pirellulaceae bacterium]